MLRGTHIGFDDALPKRPTRIRSNGRNVSCLIWNFSKYKSFSNDRFDFRKNIFCPFPSLPGSLSIDMIQPSERYKRSVSKYYSALVAASFAVSTRSRVNQFISLEIPPDLSVLYRRPSFDNLSTTTHLPQSLRVLSSHK